MCLCLSGLCRKDFREEIELSLVFTRRQLSIHTVEKWQFLDCSLSKFTEKNDTEKVTQAPSEVPRNRPKKKKVFITLTHTHGWRQTGCSSREPCSPFPAPTRSDPPSYVTLVPEDQTPFSKSNDTSGTQSYTQAKDPCT